MKRFNGLRKKISAKTRRSLATARDDR